MEAFGNKLTEARTARGLDFDQVSRETNITRRYLEALEREDFSVFPGEPYLLGFLRNYCDYLGLNSNEIISAYKHLKIQETPVPLKELMPKRPITDRLLSGPNTGKFIMFGGIALAALIVILLGVFIGGKIASSASKPAVVKEARPAATWEVSGADFRQRVYIGDVLNVTLPSGASKMTVLETAPALKLDTPAGARVIELGQDVLIDLNSDGQNDVKVFVSDLFKNDPSKGAEIRIQADASVASQVAPSGDLAASSTAQTDVTVAPAAGPAASGKQTVLFEGGSAYPVTLNATFRGYCLFRFESDRTNREERYYQKSELLTVQANNGIRIWASNGNSVKIQMIAGGKTVDLEVSKPGEVLVRDLKWIKDDSTGRYKFVVMDID